MSISEDIKALEKVLDAGPSDGPFKVDNDCVYRASDEDWGTPLIHVMTSQFMGELGNGGMTAVDAEWFAACSPDRIRRLLDALKEAGAPVRQPRPGKEVWLEHRLSKAIELLKEEQRSRLLSDGSSLSNWKAIDAFLREAGQ